MDWRVYEVCGRVRDTEKGDVKSGIAPGTAFEDLPDDRIFPGCASFQRRLRKG